MDTQLKQMMNLEKIFIKLTEILGDLNQTLLAQNEILKSGFLSIHDACIQAERMELEAERK